MKLHPSAISEGGHISHLDPYVSWRYGDHSIRLDGNFSVGELRAILAHVTEALEAEDHIEAVGYAPRNLVETP